MGRKPCSLLIKPQGLSSPPKRVNTYNSRVPDTDMLPAETPGLGLSWLTCCCSEKTWRTAATIAAESLLSRASESLRRPGSMSAAGFSICEMLQDRTATWPNRTVLHGVQSQALPWSECVQGQCLR